jgi:translocation and assembly module TamA
MKPMTTISRTLFGLQLLLLVAYTPVLAEPTLPIRIQGISGDALANVTTALQPPPGLFSDGKANPFWLNRYLRQAPDKAALALEPFGYYQAKIALQIDRTQDPPLVEVTIDPGPPVRIASRRLEIVGSQDPALLALRDQFPLAPGSILRHIPYEKAKAALQSLAVDLGYIDASYTRHLIRIDKERLSADVELVLETGPRYRFGTIRFIGGDDYPERFLRRYLAARRGEYFSWIDLGKTQQQLLDSDRFSNVFITPLPPETGSDERPVDIKLEPKAPKRLRPGIGFGTDTGARLQLRYQDVNAWHLGHEFTTDLLLAQRQQNVIVNYLFPGYRNLDTLFALRGGYQAENLDTYDTRYVFAEAEQLYGFSQNRVGSVFIRLQQERSTFSGANITTQTLMPGVRYRMARLDDATRPRSGYRLALEARGSQEGVFSEISLLQFLADLSWLHPLPWQTVLHLRGNAATTLEKSNFAEIPASLRFFAGGDGSVRGYAYQSLGPKNVAGEVIGGKHLLVGSIELEKRFLQNWGTAVFFDAGNAFDNFNDYKLAKAAGIGLRYYTPVGPARIDLARTIDSDKTNYRLHIGLGVGW